MADHVENAVMNPLSSYSNTFIERLAEKLGASANTKAVYGDPVERGGVTIIPVAKVRWGLGGGGGWKKSEDGESGGGGGGGVVAAPLGYIELKDGESVFRPIRVPPSVVPIVIASGFAGWLVLRRLYRILRASA